MAAKIFNYWKPWTIFADNSILDVWLSSEYTSTVNYFDIWHSDESTKKKYINYHFEWPLLNSHSGIFQCKVPKEY